MLADLKKVDKHARLATWRSVADEMLQVNHFRTRVPSWTWTIVVLLMLIASSSAAEDKPRERKANAPASERSEAYLDVIKAALAEFESENYAEARVMFEQAHSIRPSARTLRGMGLTSFELKEYVRAEEELSAALVDLRQPLSEPQRKEILSLLLRLERYIGKLEVKTKPTDATVTLDGRAVRGEAKIELGQHEIVAQAPGHRTLRRMVTIDGGKRQVLNLELVPDEVAAAPARNAAAEPEAASEAAPLASTSTQASAPRDADDDGSVFEEWWFWTAVGVVAAGGVVTAVALTSKSEVEAPLQGNTGPAIQVLSWSP